MNSFLLPLSFFVLLLAPTLAIVENQVLNRLTIVACLLLLVRRKFNFKFQSHHYLFLAWLAWSGIGVYFSDYPFLAFYGFYPWRCDGWLVWLIVACFAYLYWSVYENLKPLAFTSLLVILTLCIGHFIIFRRFDPEYAPIYFARFFLPQVAVSSFISQASLTLACFHPLLPLIGLFPLLDVASRIGLTALAVGSTFLTIRRYKANVTLKKGILIGLSAIALCVAMLPFMKLEEKLTKLPSFSKEPGARTQWLMQSWHLSQSLPVFGFGLDSLSEYLQTPKGNDFKDLGKVISDRSHNLMADIVLTTGWIGFGLLLFSFGYALKTAWLLPNEQNVICAIILVSYVIFGLANPHALIGNIMAVIALLGIRKEASI